MERNWFCCCKDCGEILSDSDAENGWCPKCKKYVVVHLGHIDRPVNINRAHWQEISRVTGLGKTRSMKIVIYRREHGAYRDIRDIMNIKGFGTGLYEKIKDKVRV